ncbi:BaiN/RdsA family NAD(P)/FAD-dependent oxidoreductase [Bythopirellula polymerisocia]|uniref:N-methyltryptophan oxidase n=1 Tax=Bythopirellula polymerisocia TaxID=2528003 RepID=A0A5C6CX38_9BACT|nr:NAD(P)/FAD-dependent oxidoreductase [Bythopirellula polymerisocia]TWU28137.1 N-methyltryptophan oxidase [Bythopirellula polymerisocia]
MGITYQVAVIGAGAAGMLTAARAGERGLKVVLVEKNTKAGVKILMSGGTRCNLTQATDRRGIVEAFGSQGPFLHSALAALGPDELVALFEAEGVPTKVEGTGKVFPVSDRALDVRDALLRKVRRSGVELQLGTAVTKLDVCEAGFVIQTDRGELTASTVVLTCGGQSYPGCGTTGDGYHWAKHLGHKIVPPRPALVPLLSDARWVHELSGVTIGDVRVGIKSGTTKKALAERRGSFLFTHFGISGPVVMDLSRTITARPDAEDWQAVCDFLPGHSREQFAEALAQNASAGGKRTVPTVAAQWLPQRLSEALVAEAGLSSDQRIAELSKAGRSKLIDAIKCQQIPIHGSLGFKKAEVTAGGIDLAEVDSRTLQSKLVPGLFLAGEILDLDGPIGGYNFQAAFSTGWLAGESVGEG